MALAFAVTAGSLTSPGTAYAKHGDGAAIALGIIGGALAGAAICFFNRASVLRSATGLLCRACAGLFLRAASRCVLCSGAVLWAAILLRRILKRAPLRA